MIPVAGREKARPQAGPVTRIKPRPGRGSKRTIYAAGSGVRAGGAHFVSQGRTIVKRSRRGGRRPQHGGNGGGGGGGGNNGGGGFNPNRTFDSSGPEVKIRGSASHVYEKYLQLARDANSGGDRIMAENYLQHAEHYYRIMAAAAAQQAQYQAQQAAQNPQGQGNPQGNIQGNFQGNMQGNPQGQPHGQYQPQPQAQPAPVGGSAPSFSLTEDRGEEEGEEAEAS